jgi:hypothetical protein
MKRATFVSLALALAAGSVAAALDEQQHGGGATCISGNCESGIGTVQWINRTQFTGPWQGGRFVDAIYDVRWPADPSRTFRVRMGSDGMLEEGTMVRGGAVSFEKIQTTYAGTFWAAANPFVGRNVAVFKTGRYEDAKGRIYDGDFVYIPSKLAGMGVYVFQGVRIDAEEDEVIAGLFASDEFGPNQNITFYRAREDYLVKLQNDFAGAKADADRDAQMQAFFKALLGLTNAGVNMMQGRASGSGGNRMALDLLSQVIKGQQKTDAAVETLGADLQRRIAAQPKLQNELQLAGVSTSREVAQKVAQSLLAKPRKMTQKEYAELLRQAQQP